MVVRTPTLPQPGETVLGGQFLLNPGGKGANQAVAAARLGATVTFLARVGDDIFGEQALEQLKKERIDTRYVLPTAHKASGIALITVDDKGENTIAVAPGANAHLSATDMEAAREAIHQAGIVLTQLEIPLATVEKLTQLAQEAGKRVILNPAPARDLPDSLLEQLFVITPNEMEAAMLTGIPVTDLASAERAARALSARGTPFVIITLGKSGALLWDGATATHLPAPQVEAIDTTAAGDVFNGALAVGLDEGMSLAEAALFANHAAALSVTRRGAQSAAPTHAETAAFIEKHQPTPHP
jgi:ribokinase